MKIGKREIAFLRESNAIEAVYDDDSLDQAIYAWEYLKSQKELSIGVVLKTHKILMLHQPLRPNEKGYFRTVPVWIANREGLDHRYIRERMEVWTLNAWLHSKNWKRHHIEFEKIHPFVDGNGRTGRMLMNWERRKAGLQILVIKESQRWQYYEWFRD